MARFRKTVWAYRCERCDHEWIPRAERTPTICPKCKTPYWDRPRERPRRQTDNQEPTE